MAPKKPIKQAVTVSPQELKQIVKKEVSQEIYSGPLPHPDHLKKYDEIYPGAAQIILSSFEKQSDHRRALEKKVINSNIKNERIGQIFAFILAILVIWIGGFLIYLGKNIAGLVALLTPLATLSGVFFIARKRNLKDLNQKK